MNLRLEKCDLLVLLSETLDGLRSHGLSIELGNGGRGFCGLLLTGTKAGVDGLEGALKVDRLLVLDSNRRLKFADLDLEFGNLVAQAVPLGLFPLALRSVILPVENVSKSEFTGTSRVRTTYRLSPFTRILCLEFVELTLKLQHLLLLLNQSLHQTMEVLEKCSMSAVTCLPNEIDERTSEPPLPEALAPGTGIAVDKDRRVLISTACWLSSFCRSDRCER